MDLWSHLNQSVATADENAEMTGGGGSFEAVPAGEYKGVFTAVELTERENKKGTARYIGGPVEFQIIEGQHANTTIRDFLITAHSTSQIANDNGARLLRQWIMATGCNQNIGPDNQHLLMNKPVTVRLDYEEGETATVWNAETRQHEQKTYRPKNRIRSIVVAPGATAAPAVAQPLPEPPAPTPAPAQPVAQPVPAPEPVPAAPPPSNGGAAAAMPWNQR